MLSWCCDFSAEQQKCLKSHFHKKAEQFQSLFSLFTIFLVSGVIVLLAGKNYESSLVLAFSSSSRPLWWQVTYCGHKICLALSYLPHLLLYPPQIAHHHHQRCCQKAASREFVFFLPFFNLSSLQTIVFFIFYFSLVT